VQRTRLRRQLHYWVLKSIFTAKETGISHSKLHNSAGFISQQSLLCWRLSRGGFLVEERPFEIVEARSLHFSATGVIIV